MRVHVLDPSAFTPPYDRALCAALARLGLEVELFTSRFAYGPVPPASGYEVHEFFYRLGPGRAAWDRVAPGSPAAGAPAPGADGTSSRLRLATKLAQHIPDMARYRRAAARADVVHFQWLTVQPLDVHLLPRGRPLVLTAHDILPREPRPGQLSAQRRLYERVDAVIVHSDHGRARLVEELGVAPAKVHTIHHGAFTYLTGLEREQPLPPPLAAVEQPVVLCFGLMRPYKGIDVLLDAWRQVEGAELWIVGMPRMDIERLRATAPPSVRWVPRFVTDPEIPAYFRRADVVVLPYRQIDQSGVLFTALAFGRPLVLTDVGGFSEIAREGAARLVAPGDPEALGRTLAELVVDPAARGRLGDAARAAAAGPYAWDTAARRTAELYETLVSTSSPAR
ncbi:MAG TPA: glycosyltransferase family 4 protein [Solirubrobacteraceae bacterium]|jgi:glycosyltransferase involved in cell wall biosynthesis|nr:glycosyltransferase family 4 protein [Solirubrobacteraceae bacterium]